MTALTDAALGVLVLALHRLGGWARSWPDDWPEDWHERMTAVDADVDWADARLHPARPRPGRGRH